MKTLALFLATASLLVAACHRETSHRTASDPMDATTAAAEIRAGWASYHITVTDTVAAVHQATSGQWYLNFGAAHPNATLSAWVPKSYTRAGKRAWFASLDGQRVTVKGQARFYNGHPEVVIRDLDDITTSTIAASTTAHELPTNLATR